MCRADKTGQDREPCLVIAVDLAEQVAMEKSGKEIRHWQVDAQTQGLRADLFFAEKLAVSRRQIQRWLLQGALRVDGKRPAKGLLLRSGQQLSADLSVCKRGVSDFDTFGSNLPAIADEAILFADAQLLVINKPAGLPAQSQGDIGQDCLLHRVALRFPEVLTAGPDPREGGLLHRLDVGTSGAIAFSRNAQADAHWRPRLRKGRAAKFYLALVHDPQQQLDAQGLIDWPLAHAGRGGRMRALQRSGLHHRGAALPACSAYQVLQRGAELSLVLVLIRRGRMHQIRVHLATLGTPILGDPRYGVDEKDVLFMLAHQALHAWILDLGEQENRPVFRAPLPAWMSQALDSAGILWPQDPAESEKSLSLLKRMMTQRCPQST